MDDSKFINKQTLAYLQSKKGVHVEQQVKAIKERLDLEYNYLNHQITDHAEELTNKINYLSQSIQDTRSAFDDKLRRLDLEYMYNFRLRDRWLIALTAGIITWLTILSI